MTEQPERSNVNPAVQRWAIAWAEHERSALSDEAAAATMEREREATAAAIEAAPNEELWVELLDGTRLLLRLADVGRPFVRVRDLP